MIENSLIYYLSVLDVTHFSPMLFPRMKRVLCSQSYLGSRGFSRVLRASFQCMCSILAIIECVVLSRLSTWQSLQQFAQICVFLCFAN